MMPTSSEWVAAAQRGAATVAALDSRRLLLHWGDDYMVIDVITGKGVPFRIVPRDDSCPWQSAAR